MDPYKSVEVLDFGTILIPKSLHGFFDFQSHYKSRFDFAAVYLIVRFLDMANKHLDAYCIPFEKRADMTPEARDLFKKESKKTLLESIVAANELGCNFYSSYAAAHFSLEFVDSLITQ